MTNIKAHDQLFYVVIYIFNAELILIDRNIINIYLQKSIFKYSYIRCRQEALAIKM